jgi:MoaA/NifB/PqqE/SkfB family radical SAM enzyme
MITVLDLLSQWTLEVTPECNLKCGACSLWDSGKRVRKGLLESIQEGSFFAQFPNKKLVNVVGGDPFENLDLTLILSGLKAQGIKTRLWTNGIAQPEQWRSVKDLVDSIMVYLPTVAPEDYQLSTGFATWEEFEESIRFLKKNRYPFSFHTPVKQDNLADLPDLHAYAKEFAVPLMFHYRPKDCVHPEHEKYISRFFRVKGVSVYKKKTAVPGTVCPALPYGDVQHPYQVLKNAFFDQFK